MKEEAKEKDLKLQNYTAVLKKSGNQYVALSLELGVVGSGNTRDDAIQSLYMAIESYLDYAKEMDLPETRPVAIQQLHKFLFLDENADPVEFRNDQAQITTLAYA